MIRSDEVKNPVADLSGSARIFGFFNEIGIINQLATALFANSLPDDIHPSHFSILNHLFRTGDGKSPVRIAAAMQVTKATMTHSLRVLEARGFIETQPDPNDARAKLVYLTASGKRFRDHAIANVTNRFGHLLDRSHLAIMDRIHDDLVTMRKHLDENRQ